MNVVKRSYIKPGTSLIDRLRFYSKPDANGCHIWIGYKRANEGYGRLQFERKLQSAHRLAWEAHNGPVPDGLLVLHECDVRSCINPEHLFLGTNQDNTDDKVLKGRHTFFCGEEHPMAKLTLADARSIRTSTVRSGTLAKQYNVSRGTINSIRRGETWKENTSTENL